MSKTVPQPLLSADDPRDRFVRFHRLTEGGFVEFGFAIGSADLMVDLILPLEAYREFCTANRVRFVTREQRDAQDFDRSKWRYGIPGATE